MDRPLNSSPEVVTANESLLGAYLKSALGVAIGLGLGFLAVRKTGVSWDDLVQKFSAADPLRIILGALGGFVLTCTQAVRWRAILRGVAPGVRFWTIFQSKLVGYAANSILPARLGDLVRIEFVSTITGVARSKVLATGVTDLWFDKIGWIITFIFAYFVAPMPDWVSKTFLIMGSIILAIGTALVILSRGSKGANSDSFLGRFREGLEQPHLLRLFLNQLWLSPLSWIWETLLILFVASALGVDISFSQAFAVLTAFNISMAIPIPANAGAFEVAATYTLTAFGIAPDRAIAFAVIYHLILLIPGVIVGATIFGLKTGSFKFFRRVGKVA